MKSLTFAILCLTFGWHTPICADTLTFKKASDAIIQVGKFLHANNMCPATSSNFSIKLNSDRIAITASGVHKGFLEPKDILLSDAQGNILNSDSKSSAETLLHLLVYDYYPHVGAILHHHSLNSTIIHKILENPEAFITAGYEIHKVFPGIHTHESQVELPIFENSQDYIALSKEIQEYFQTHQNVFGFLLKGHGLYTWGATMKEAQYRAEAFELLFESELKLKLLKGVACL